MILHTQKSHFISPPHRALCLALIVVLAFGLACLEATAQSKDSGGSSQAGDSSSPSAPKAQSGTNLGEVGAKLANSSDN